MNARQPLSFPLWLAAGLASIFCSIPLTAASFTVQPVQVTLGPKAGSTLVTISSLTEHPVNFQVSAFRWSMDETGESRLEPTGDLLFFPQILTLEPRAERKIRVGAAVPFGDTEGTYRLIVEELRAEKNRSGVGIQILTRMSIPVFLAPAKPASDPRIASVAMEHGRLTFRVENRGNLHAAPHRLRVSGLDATGAEVLAQELEGWYLLAGRSRSHEMEVAQEVCPRLRTVEIQAEVGGAPLAQRLQVPDGACVPSSPG